MPKPAGKSNKRYMPGLDGLRGVAVLAVIAYHFGFDWSSGGLLGVGVFFTLSGYLITDILLERWATRRLALKEFWLARARRLLPALFLVLIVVTAWVTIGDPSQLDKLRGEVTASALFFANWWFIFQDVSYFDQFGPPSPLGHIWSLGIEEQFYILWPWLLLAGLWFFGQGSGGRRRSQIQPQLALVTLGLALVSFIVMLIVFHPGQDPTRAYEGTDSRAFGLLIGAALAMVWPSRYLTGPTATGGRLTLDLAGAAGLATIFILIATTSEYSSFIYRGGLVLLSIATAAVVAAVTHPATWLGRILGFAPLKWIGVRSYGIYLWQSPIILLTTPALAPFSLPRAAAQVGATFLISALCWKYVEDPIRHGAIGRLWRRFRQAGFRIPKPQLDRLQWSGVAAAGLIALFAFIGMAGVTFSKPLLPIAQTRSADLAGIDRTITLATGGDDPGSETAVTEPDPTRSACSSVAYIGESTSLGMVDTQVVTDPANRLDARLKAVGAGRQQLDMAGSRSVFDAEDGTRSGEQAAREIRQGDSIDCWVVALGINDSGLASAGIGPDMGTRIAQMMSATGGDPVMWVNPSMLPNADIGHLYPEIVRWNKVLAGSCRLYPQLRVYDWVADVRPDWYGGDGVHYGPDGYAERAKLIAAALVSAFPSGQPLPAGDDPEAGFGEDEAADCIVHPARPVLRRFRKSRELAPGTTGGLAPGTTSGATGEAVPDPSVETPLPAP